MKRLIAVVDDETRVLESLENLLESANYRVCVFSSAEAFLADAGMREAHCLVSDIVLPGIDGLQLLGQLDALRPDLPVILITAQDRAAQGGAAGTRCRGILRKPFQGTELLDLVDGALRMDRR